jgi:hypothetical protein
MQISIVIQNMDRKTHLQAKLVEILGDTNQYHDLKYGKKNSPTSEAEAREEAVEVLGNMNQCCDVKQEWINSLASKVGVCKEVVEALGMRISVTMRNRNR